jgi:BirA family biotin operon repressor/biotin-[acetyl-CoA-carboxylase] ligase
MSDQQPDLPSSDGPGASEDAPLRIDEMRHGLRGLMLGNPLIYLPAVDSTNTYASALARAGAAEGALIVTDHQTAGRGRVGRVWKALPNQQLILSFILRPTFPAHYLMMASALAVAEAIEAETSLRAGIKWPNDVLVNGRKVCGILIETGEGAAILGMGLNVNGALASDPELAARATTLAAEAGVTIPREPLAIAITRHLDEMYRQLSSGGPAALRALRDRWRARLVTLGRRATIRQAPNRPETLEGLAVDVDSEGALLLRLDDGRLLPVTWGDVE